MLEEMKNLIYAKTENDDLRERTLDPKFIIMLSIFITAAAVFFDNPANSINFRVFVYQNAVRLNLRPPLIMISAMFLGPFWGAVIGGLIDIISYYVWNSNLDYVFLITITSILRGFASGYIFNNYFKKFSLRSVVYSIALPHYIISGILIPLILYFEFSIPFFNNFRIRSTILAFTIPIYIIIAYYILSYFKKDRELKLMHKKLQEMVKYDDLTGLYNKKEFITYLNKMIAFARRQERKLSLLMVDLDHFKEFNDNFGHQCGDMVLESVAEVFKKFIRKEDMAARIGGEEFAVLLVDCSLEDAEKLAERLKKEIASLKFDNVDKQITASFGLTNLGANDNGKSFINRSDRALYLAKENGRNRVEEILL
jgi:ECF transporter S component (folate family)